jgi:flagellar motor switch protein FliM
MKALKLTPEQLTGLKSKPKLNQFWSGYFQSITIELNRLFFSIFRENIVIRPVSCDVVSFDDYLENSTQNSIVQFFKIHPHNSFGFYHLPFNTVDLLMNRLLGGKVANEATSRDITQVDHSIIEVVTAKLMDVLEAPFVKDNRELSFELIDLDENLMMHSLSSNKQYICVQQYLIQLGDNYYYFDIAFTNQFLDRFVLL